MGTEYFGVALPSVGAEVKGALTAVILGALFLGLVIEGVGGRRMPGIKHSYQVNLSTFLFNDTVLSLMSLTLLLAIAQQFSHWGFLAHLQQPILKGVVAFILVDLLLYAWHRACHSYDLLWCFHKVHHSDEVMNVTTGFRLHITEVVLVTFLKAALIVIAGLDAGAVLAAEGVITVFVLFHHLNISFRGEQWLAHVFTVPRLHRVHHSRLRREHRSNYGAALSLWDRWFGTLIQVEPLEIGLEGVSQQGFFDLLRYGFTYQSSRLRRRTSVIRVGNVPLGLGTDS